MDETPLIQRIHQLLNSQKVLTLSFCDAAGPWSVPVYFAADNLQLTIISGINSRHSKAVDEGLDFSASLFSPNDHWKDLYGIQMAGKLSRCEKKDIAASSSTYLKKFPFTKTVLENSVEEIGVEAENLQFYLFTPDKIVLTDNRVHFGFRWEYLPPPR